MAFYYHELRFSSQDAAIAFADKASELDWEDFPSVLDDGCIVWACGRVYPDEVLPFAVSAVKKHKDGCEYLAFDSENGGPRTFAARIGSSGKISRLVDDNVMCTEFAQAKALSEFNAGKSDTVLNVVTVLSDMDVEGYESALAILNLAETLAVVDEDVLSGCLTPEAAEQVAERLRFASDEISDFCDEQSMGRLLALCEATILDQPKVTKGRTKKRILSGPI
jgi:hypothetical protein